MCQRKSLVLCRMCLGKRGNGEKKYHLKVMKRGRKQIRAVDEMCQIWTWKSKKRQLWRLFFRQILKLALFFFGFILFFQEQHSAYGGEKIKLYQSNHVTVEPTATTSVKWILTTFYKTWYIVIDASVRSPDFFFHLSVNLAKNVCEDQQRESLVGARCRHSVTARNYH